MGLNLKYIPSTYFQEALLDKATGEPLAAGIVTFYQDQARTELKPMYRITGTPPNYTYVELPNPLTLSSIGTIQDGSGNDVVPYYYPYDDEGNIELYYITIVNSGAVAQFTREGQPNVAVTNGEEDQFINYITNGQFIAHNSIAETPTREEGEITEELTNVAPGAWYFKQDPTSTADDFVFFNRFGSPTTNPPDSPRYEIQITCTSPDVGDAFKWFSVRFRNVNTFESDIQQYTISFSGKSATATQISTLVNKNFGTGGSGDVEDPLQNINLTTDYKIYNIPVIFGDNAGKTLGDIDDDYIEVVIALPTSAVFDVQFTNFVLTIGDVTLTGYPITPEYEVSSRALAGGLPMPDYEGQYLYLPIVNGPNGFEYDDSEIGKTSLLINGARLGRGYLVSEGAVLDVDEYSSDNIPYRRLFEFLVYNPAENFTMNGPGEFFVIAENAGPFFELVGTLTANAYTNAADGAVSTGFAFALQTAIPYRFRITPIAATSITPGAWFEFYSADSEGPLKFVVWLTIDGVGTKPVVASTHRYINVDIPGSYTASQVSGEIGYRINSTYYKLPDPRGYFLRFQDAGAGRDPDAGTRTATWTGSLVTGDNPNTIQGDENKSHAHTNTSNVYGSDAVLANQRIPASNNMLGHTAADTYTTDASSLKVFRDEALSVVVNADGGSESRPINISYIGVIKY